MSNTIVDMPKVCQMFDAGWHVKLFKNELGNYTGIAKHYEDRVIERCRGKTFGPHDTPILDEDDEVVTDDFTPEQCLTRLAYKVHGEIL